MICSRCGHELPANSQFCLRCGQPLGTAVPEVTQYAAPPGVPVAAAPPVPSRRPIIPLLICIAILLLLVASLIAYRAGLFASNQAKPGSGSMVAANPQPNTAPITVTQQPNPRQLPMTPTTQPPPPQPLPASAEPKQPKMPADVLGYLRWLQQVDITRSTIDGEAKAEMPKYIAEMMMGGMASALNEDDPSRDFPNPTAQHVNIFQQWYQKLRRLQQTFQSMEGLGRFMPNGQAYVPQECNLLHSYFGQALSTQVGASQELAVAMAAKDMNRAQTQMAASARSVELLQRADAEFGAICEKYKMGQFYRLKIDQSSTNLPGLPR